MPFEEEMALCDYLAKHLQQTFLSDNDAAAANGNGAATGAAAAAPSGSGAALENDGVRLQAFKCVPVLLFVVMLCVCRWGSGSWVTVV